VEGSVFLFFFSCPRLTTRMMMTFPIFTTGYLLV
jgi:hypothetical protein